MTARVARVEYEASGDFRSAEAPRLKVVPRTSQRVTRVRARGALHSTVRSSIEYETGHLFKMRDHGREDGDGLGPVVAGTSVVALRMNRGRKRIVAQEADTACARE